MTSLYLSIMFLSLWVMIARNMNFTKYTGRFFSLILLISLIHSIPNKTMFILAMIYLSISIYSYIFGQKEPKYKTINIKNSKKWFFYPLEFIGLSIFRFIFSHLPLETSSYTLGKLAEIFGPFTRGEKVIKMNLNYIMPQNNTKQFRKQIWNSWGRSFAEGLFIDYYKKNEKKYITYKNLDLLKKIQENKSFLTALMHYDTMGLVALPFSKFSFTTGVVYRFPNNYLTDSFFHKNFGGKVANTEFIPKGYPRAIISRLNQGGNVAISPDLRINEGEKLSFFGKPALTSTGIVKMAVLFNIPIILCYVHRTHGVHHEVVFEEIINVISANTKEESEKQTMQYINDKTEKIIKQDPIQWFWMHSRWGKNI